jgi:hypothetical protein
MQLTGKAGMFHYIQGFRPGLESRMDPFEQHPDSAGRRYRFIYLTGRGTYSYLFPSMPENDIVAEAEAAIPMGYTQIWILEWIAAIRPESGKKIQPSQRRAAQNLRLNGVLEGRSHILIGENGQCFGCTEKLQAAIGASRLLAVEKHIRIAIGLLAANITWH